jgi:arylsulfatase A-like enzyme
MKAIMVMFDSLNRHMLPPYGCDWTVAPNFKRLAERTAVFDHAYVGSMPCMPARRELHTGRYNFLHRSWGPLEPFDESMPEILKNNGIYTHLVSDHYHYWEDGGCTYHTRFSSWDFTRGQEGDPWKAHLPAIHIPEHIGGRPGQWDRQDWSNRLYMPREEDQPQAKTFALGLDFIRTNAAEDNWFLQIETFDPHEPFFTQQHYQDLYPHDYRGPFFDWPDYARVHETPEQVQHLRCQYTALLSMCDTYLGKILDAMDEHNLWQDTLLIVNTDHGFLLSEHDWWGKVVMPFYNEIAHTPLFIWDPRCRVSGERRSSLVQTIDLAPTLLDYFGVDIPASVQGVPLKDTVAADKPVRQAGLFGVHGGHVNITDGHYVYMRAPVSLDNTPLYDYTLMPTHMRGPFNVSELQDIQLASPFPFTKGCRLMKINASAWPNSHQFGTLLFDLDADPAQLHPIQDAGVEARLARQMVELMRANDAPQEQYLRLGLIYER